MDSHSKSDPITDVKGDSSSRDTSSSHAPHPVAEKGYGTHDQNLDQAYWYVQSSSTAVEATPAELRRLRRKVDWWIVPIMFASYTMQFIDKVSLNVGTWRLLIMSVLTELCTSMPLLWV